MSQEDRVKELHELAAKIYRLVGDDPATWDQIERDYGIRLTYFTNAWGKLCFLVSLPKEDK
jgi:hypothetical protein